MARAVPGAGVDVSPGQRFFSVRTTSFYQSLKSVSFIGIKFDLLIAKECLTQKTPAILILDEISENVDV